MFNNTKNEIKIGILEISPQNKAILEYYFSTSGKSLYKETSTDDASAFIIDFDYPDAKERWEELSKTSQKPTIIISIKEVSIPSTIWLAKPLTAKSLTDAAVKIEEMLLASSATSESTHKIHSAVATQIEQKPVQQDTHSFESNISDPQEATITDSVESLIDSLDTKIKTDKEEDIVEAVTTKEKALAEAVEPAAESLSFNEPLAESPDEDVINSLTTADVIKTDSLAQGLQQTSHSSAEKDIDSLLESLISGQGTTATTHQTSRLVSDEPSLAVKESGDMDFVLENISLEEPSEDLAKNIDTLIQDSEAEAPLLDNEDKTAESIPQASVEDVLLQTESFDEQQEFLLNEIDKVEINTVPEDSIELSSIGFDLSQTNPLEGSSFTTAEAELQSLLNEIREEAEKQIHDDPDNSVIDENKTAPSASRYEEKTNAEVRWVQLCGDKDTIKKQDVKKHSFENSNHMLETLIRNINLAKTSQNVTRLMFDDIAIVIDCTVDSIYCNYSVHSEEFIEYCFEPLNSEDIKIFELDNSEIRMYRSKMEEKPEKTHSIESFIWTTSLLTSKGRLPEKTDITKTISLKTWPDLTRLEQMPHAMQIAAVLSKIPASIENIALQLKIPQRYVFAFYNGALSLNMIEFDKNNFKTSTFSIDELSKKSNDRGFFGRLLKKLTG